MLFDAECRPKETRTFLCGMWAKREEFTDHGKKVRTLWGPTHDFTEREKDGNPYDGIFFTEFPEKNEIHLDIYDFGQLIERRIIRYGFTPNICRDNR